MTISHLHMDFRQFPVPERMQEHGRIDLGLGQMYRHGAFHIGQFPVSPLDLIHSHALRLIYNAVGPALQHQAVVLRRMHVSQRHFSLVLTAHPSLNHAVNTPPLLHGLIRGRMMPVIYISAAHDKLHQFSDRDSDFLCDLLLFLRCGLFPAGCHISPSPLPEGIAASQKCFILFFLRSPLPYCQSRQSISSGISLFYSPASISTSVKPCPTLFSQKQTSPFPLSFIIIYFIREHNSETAENAQSNRKGTITSKQQSLRS